VVPHGFFPYHVAPTPKTLEFKKKINITFFGRILEYKGVDILLDAWPSVRKRLPKAILNIYGEGIIPESPVLATHADSIMVRNNWIPEGDIKRIFEETDIMVFPYKESSQSGVVAIAFPAGIPVVITPLSGLIEQLKYGGGVISKTFSPNDLSEAILLLAQDINKYRELSAQCILGSKVLTWEKIAANVQQFVANV
jgi:glycosyltransferase involved in cell wall biosynthesis